MVSPEPQGSSNDCTSPVEGVGAEPLFRWGPLMVLEKIGEGGFGEVYRAFEPILQREIALKLAWPELDGSAGAQIRAPMDEARRLARVRHPNVLIVHGIEEHAGRVGMWTEYIHGETLEQLLAAGGPLDSTELTRIAIALCRALAAVHSAGIVHGEVRTSNLMRETGGRIVLMDFGAGTGSKMAQTSGSGAAKGATESLAITAPELAQGGQASTSTDIFAAGATFYRLATGRSSIPATTAEETSDSPLSAVRRALAEARPDLPQAVCDAIVRALAPDPADRFDNMLEMRAVLESSIPAVGALAGGTHPAHLPEEVGRFIGREAALLEIRRLVLHHPVVTLVGVGGGGKTRLALRVAAQLHEVFEDGAHWIDLASAGEGEALAARVAHVLGIPESGNQRAETILIEHLRHRRILLVLDNCEHVRAATAELVDAIIQNCGRLHTLATSREDLGLASEVRFDVVPLALPEPDSPRDTTDGLHSGACESTRLFVDRAQISRPGFSLTPANSRAIARICRRVDGIPLAIELAAARVSALGTEQIASRLEESFRLLSGGRGSASPHHQTMQACIEWSFRLLSREEQILLCRLSVLAGRWSLEAAKGTCADSPEAEVGSASTGKGDVGDLLSALVEKSLVRFEAPGDEERDPARVSYRMLEVVRAFAKGLLEPEDEAATRQRMLSYYCGLAERARSDMSTPREGPWMGRFAAEHENFRIVLDGCAGGGAALGPALRIIAVLRRYWLVRRHLREGLAWTQRLLLPHVENQQDRADAYYIAASLAAPQSEYGLARRYGEEALPLMRSLGDRKGTAAVLAVLGLAAVDQGDYGEGRSRLEEAIAIDRELGNLGPIPSRLNSLGIMASRQKDLARAETYFRQALEMFRESGNLIGLSTMLTNLSTNARVMGQIEQARSLAEEALPIARQTGHAPCEAQAIRALAIAYLQLRDFTTARRMFRDALRIEQESEDAVQIVWCLEGLGQLEEQTGNAGRAVLLMAAADAIRDAKGVPIPDLDRMDRSDRLESLRGLLGVAEFDAAWAAGRAMTVKEVVDFVLGFPA